MATKAERCRVEDVIWELEMRTPIEETATSEALLGRWALVYASEDATRSSPFFWAFRYCCVLYICHFVSFCLVSAVLLLCLALVVVLCSTYFYAAVLFVLAHACSYVRAFLVCDGGF